MPDTEEPRRPIRRIVTGNTPDGRSKVWLDGPAANVKTPTEFIRSTLLWATDETPAKFLSEEDAGEWKLGTSPPPNGTRFVHFEMAPGDAVTEAHRTDTLDYFVCTAGEMTMILDEDTVVLRPGDIVVGRGFNHSWVNNGDVSAVLVAVSLDGQPKREGSMSGMDQAH